MISIHLILIFLIALPISLVTGPFLPDLFISLIGLLYIFINHKNLKFLFLSKISIIFFCFYILLLTSTIFSYKPFISIENSLFYFRYLFFFLGVYYILETNSKVIKYLIYSFSITFFIIYLDSLIQYFYGFNLTGYPIDQHGGINSFFGTNEDGILGSYVVRLTPIFCALIAYECNKTIKVNLIIILLILGSSVISLFSQERSAFALSLIVFFSYVYLTDIFNLKLKILITTILIVMIASIIFINLEIYTRYIISVRDQFFNNNNFYIFSSLHQAHYESAIKMFLDKPFFGIGPKMFRYYCDFEIYYVLNACSTHPHNNYIQLLAETGFFTFSFTLFIFFILLYMYFKQLISIFINKNSFYKPHFILIVSSIFISLWPLAPTGSFFNNWLNVIYYLPVGFLIYFIKNNKYKNIS